MYALFVIMAIKSWNLNLPDNMATPLTQLVFFLPIGDRINGVLLYRVFSHDIMVAILVSQNNEAAAMLVSQTNHVGVELFCYANTFFCSNKFA